MKDNAPTSQTTLQDCVYRVPQGEMLALLEATRIDAYRRVLASAKTMTRDMLIHWLEAEVSGT